MELRRLSPKLADWTEERLSDNPPRLFRLRQLVALFRAFGLPWDPESFVNGKFIEPEHPRYAGILTKLLEETPMSPGDHSVNHRLPTYFWILFSYRTRVGEVLSTSDDVLVAGGLFQHAYQMVGDLNQVIQERVAVIDESLAALVSPEGASFSVEELVRDHGYPDVDLLQIDGDWW
jgi:hypothetical protein